MANEQLPGLEALIKGVLDDPARVAQLQGILSSLGAAAPADAQTEADTSTDVPSAPAQDDVAPARADAAPPDLLSGLLSNPALLSRLPALLSAAGAQAGGSDSHASAKPHSPDHRTALLLALKPYLNDGRREMIDYIVNLSRLGNLLNR